MSETRSFIAADNILHIAVVAKRRHGISVWKIAAIIILAIPVLVGFIDVISRLDAWLSTAHAAPYLSVAQDVPASSLVAAAGQGLASSTPLIPARLRIPAIGVNAGVQELGLNSSGAMQAPSNFIDVGWYKDGAAPGGLGSAVFDGHVNNALTTAGVFEHLAQLAAGDQIIVSDASGRSVTYSVESVKTYSVDGAPLDEIFSTVGAPQLVLITCDGTWDAAKKEFDERLVVYAKLGNS